MKKLSIATAFCLAAFATAASAETKLWQVTEETDANIKYGQGSWKVTKEGDKITGTADIMDDVTTIGAGHAVGAEATGRTTARPAPQGPGLRDRGVQHAPVELQPEPLLLLPRPAGRGAPAAPLLGPDLAPGRVGQRHRRPSDLDQVTVWVAEVRQGRPAPLSAHDDGSPPTWEAGTQRATP